MNKKVDEEFIGIKDVYVLQCICTELNQARKKAIEYIQNENNITKHGIYPNYTYEVDTKDLLNILQNGGDKDENI